MSHIHTDTGQHDFTVGAYIIRYDIETPKALLHLHKRSGMLFPIGGHIELSETPWQALAREIAEESGYDFSRLKVLQPQNGLRTLSDVIAHPIPVVISDHDVSNTHFHTDLAYAFLADDFPTNNIDESESQDLRWLTLDQIKTLDSDVIYPNTKEIYTFIIDNCLKDWDKINVNNYKL